MRTILLAMLLMAGGGWECRTAEPTLWRSIAVRKFKGKASNASRSSTRDRKKESEKKKSYRYRLTPGGSFRIAYPSRFDRSIRPIDVLEKALLDAEKKLKALGFKFDSLSRPIEVTVVPPDQLSSQSLLAEEETPRKLFRSRYPIIKINEEKLLRNAGNEDHIRAVIGHEFFHAVQNLYDPSWFDSEHALFLAEMSSVWFEHKMVRNPAAYLPSVADNYANFTNYGLDDLQLGKHSGIWVPTNAFKIDTRARLGYGASNFLHFLTLYFQDDKIVHEIWKEFRSGKSALEAIDTVVKSRSKSKTGAGIDRVWRAFVKDYYNRFSVNSWLKGAGNFPKPEENAVLNLKKTKRFSKSFTMPPFSAVSLFLGVRGDVKEPMEMNITIDGGSISASLFSASDGKELIYALQGHGKVNRFPLPYQNRYKSFRLLLINDSFSNNEIRLTITAERKKKKKRTWPSAGWIEKASLEDLVRTFCPRPGTKGNGIRHIVNNTMRDPIHYDYYIDEKRNRLNIGPHISKWGETVTLTCYEIVDGKNVATDTFTLQWHEIEYRGGKVKRGYFVDFEQHRDRKGRQHGPFRKWSKTDLFLDAMYRHGRLVGCKSYLFEKDMCETLR